MISANKPAGAPTKVRTKPIYREPSPASRSEMLKTRASIISVVVRCSPKDSVTGSKTANGSGCCAARIAGFAAGENGSIFQPAGVVHGIVFVSGWRIQVAMLQANCDHDQQNRQGPHPMSKDAVNLVPWLTYGSNCNACILSPVRTAARNASRCPRNNGYLVCRA